MALLGSVQFLLPDDVRATGGSARNRAAPRSLAGAAAPPPRRAPQGFAAGGLTSDPAGVDGAGWHRDDYRQPLPAEQPGPPEPGGAWEIASRLSRSYAFADPTLVEAHYDAGEPLEGRNMLLIL